MRVRPLLVPLAALAIAAALPARATAQIEQGDKRFSLNGTLSKSVTQSGSDVEGNVTGEFGWYWRRNVALNAGAGISFSGSTVLTLLAVGTEYNFSDPGDTKVPFVSMNVGTLFGGGISAIVVQPQVGEHFFLSRQTSFDVNVEYTYTAVQVSGASGNDGTVALNFGFSFYFGHGDKR